MDVQGEMLAVLKDAEDSLAERLRSALDARAYGDVATIASVSARLRQLVQSVMETGNGDGSQASDPPTASHESAGATAGPVGSSRQAYPRFERQGDRLVKIGWSKKDRAEYEHKAPYAAVVAVTEALRDAASAEFTIDGLGPIHGVDGSEIPSYQLYLVLAWLRSVGAVRKESRGGYVGVQDRLRPAALKDYWQSLHAADGGEA